MSLLLKIIWICPCRRSLILSLKCWVLCQARGLFVPSFLSATVFSHCLYSLTFSFAFLLRHFVFVILLASFCRTSHAFSFSFLFFLFLFSSASMGFICPLLCPFVSFSLFCPFKLSLNYRFLSVTILRHFLLETFTPFLLVYFRKQKYPWPHWSHSEFMIIRWFHLLQRKKRALTEVIHQSVPKMLLAFVQFQLVIALIH